MSRMMSSGNRLSYNRNLTAMFNLYQVYALIPLLVNDQSLLISNL